MMKKVGIITWHYCNNYGSFFQVFALQSFVESLGYETEIKNYRKPGNSLVKRAVKRAVYLSEKLTPSGLVAVLRKIFGSSEIFGFKFWSARNRMLRRTKLTFDKEKLNKKARNYYAVICGSDQIWAPRGLDTAYMLDFVPDGVRRISYAASIGFNYIPDELKDTYKKYISRLDSVSVREETGVRLLAECCGICAEDVLDPTFLIERSTWESLATETLGEEDFIFCYFLNPAHKYKSAVTAAAGQLGCSIMGVSANGKDAEWLELNNDITPEAFLERIKKARAVFTDSFHGTALSLILNKDFFVFERFESSDPVNQNSRIYSVLKKAGLSDRIVNVNGNADLSQKIDYFRTNRLIGAERQKSAAFLKKALGDANDD